MSELMGMLFLLSLPIFVWVGLRYLSKPRTSTVEEHQRRAAESGSALSAGVNALNGILNPESEKGKRGVEEMTIEKETSQRATGEGK